MRSVSATSPIGSSGGTRGLAVADAPRAALRARANSSTRRRSRARSSTRAAIGPGSATCPSRTSGAPSTLRLARAQGEAAPLPARRERHLDLDGQLHAAEGRPRSHRRSDCGRRGWSRTRRARSAPRASERPPSGTISSSASVPSVSVPVLSTQTTSTPASDSTADSRCTSAPRRAMRAAPTANATEASSTRPSGTSVTQPAVAVDTASRIGVLWTSQRGEQQRRDRHHHDDHQAQQAVDVALQRRELAALRTRGLGQRARVRVVADHVGPVDASPGDAEAAGPHLVAERPPDRVGLAGQHRLVELQRASLEQRSVRDHLLSGLEPDRVALDDALDRHRDGLAVADDARARGHEQRQPVELPLGPQLLEDADRRVDDHDPDEQQVRELAHGDERDREPDQDQVEQRERVLADDRARRAARALVLDGSARIQAALRLGVTQPDCGSHRLHAIGRLGSGEHGRAHAAAAARAARRMRSSCCCHPCVDSPGPLWWANTMNRTRTPMMTTALRRNDRRRFIGERLACARPGALQHRTGRDERGSRHERVAQTWRFGYGSRSSPLCVVRYSEGAIAQSAIVKWSSTVPSRRDEPVEELERRGDLDGDLARAVTVAVLRVEPAARDVAERDPLVREERGAQHQRHAVEELVDRAPRRRASGRRDRAGPRGGRGSAGSRSTRSGRAARRRASEPCRSDSARGTRRVAAPLAVRAPAGTEATAPRAGSAP